MTTFTFVNGHNPYDLQTPDQQKALDALVGHGVTQLRSGELPAAPFGADSDNETAQVLMGLTAGLSASVLGDEVAKKAFVIAAMVFRNDEKVKNLPTAEKTLADIGQSITDDEMRAHLGAADADIDIERRISYAWLTALTVVDADRDAAEKFLSISEAIVIAYNRGNWKKALN